jgi:hypothetical protein
LRVGLAASNLCMLAFWIYLFRRNHDDPRRPLCTR